MTESSVTATADQISQARQTLNHSVNPYDPHQSNNIMLNQALYYQTMNNQLQFMNHPNQFNQSHMQYIQNPMANPQTNFLYQATQQGFLNSMNQTKNVTHLDNQQIELNSIKTPFKAPFQAVNSPKVTSKNKLHTNQFSTPDDHSKDRTDMFKKTRPDNDTPNRRFNQINEVRNVNKKNQQDSARFESNRYSCLVDESDVELHEQMECSDSNRSILEVTVVNKEQKSKNLEKVPNKKNIYNFIKPVFTSIFTGSSLEIFKDYKLIYKELRSFKPNIHVKSAFLNKKNELVIQTDSRHDQINIENEWNSKAFETGITLKVNSRRFFAAIKGMSKRINFENLDDVKQEYRIKEFLRMNNKDKEPTTTVRIELYDEESLNKIIQHGIYYENYHYRVSEWENRVIMCFKCQGFGHKSDKCEKEQACVKCSGNHSSKECIKPKEEYLCKNCGQNHASWKNNCPKMIQKKIETNTRWSQIVAAKSNSYNERTAESGLNRTNIQNENLTNDLLKQLLERVIKLEKKLSENTNENDAHDNYFVQSSYRQSNRHTDTLEQRISKLEKQNDSVVKINKELAQKVKEQEEIISNLKKNNQKNSSSISNNQTNSTATKSNLITSNLNQLENSSNYLQQNHPVDISNNRFEGTSSEPTNI